MDKKKLILDEWIKKAEQDLGMAKLAIEHQPEFRESICFHCQQAAEKYLKAYLIYLEIVFKKSHSLDYLLDLISEQQVVSDDFYITAEILEDYGVEVRYPGYSEPTEREVEEAYKAATSIRNKVVQKMDKK
ncbi:MAG TPA: HEPN domain-containing protein [Clostridiaceae bacterium]